MKLSFTKMQGCANDYIYLDCRTAVCRRTSQPFRKTCPGGIFPSARTASSASAPAHRRGGRHDAHLQRRRQRGQDVRQRHPLRGRVAVHPRRCKETLAIDTLSGLKTITRRGAGLWQVEMGAYSTMPAGLPAVNMGEGPAGGLPTGSGGQTWRVTCISVGNPHCVTVVPDVDSLKLEEIGPAFEHHANFPERINTEFVQVVDATHLKMRVWERGSGETWACGTGTCATVAAMTELGICPAGEDVHVQLRGGELIIRVLPGNNCS